MIVYQITVKLSGVKHQFVMFTDSIGRELGQLSDTSISAPWHPRHPLEDSLEQLGLLQQLSLPLPLWGHSLGSLLHGGSRVTEFLTRQLQVPKTWRERERKGKRSGGLGEGEGEVSPERKVSCLG